MTTKIEWTDATWNPVVGCSKASPGCQHCYAETMARRMRAMGRPEYQEAHDGRGWTGRAVLVPERLSEPLRWRKPRMVFVDSMGDLFHPTVRFETIAAVFGVMAACPQHQFQLLTKRAERMAAFFEWLSSVAQRGFGTRAEVLEAVRGAAIRFGVDAKRLPRDVHANGVDWPLPNVWLGVTAEDQEHADRRIPRLLQCPAAVRFLSVEPMLSALDLTGIIGYSCASDGADGCRWRGTGDETVGEDYACPGCAGETVPVADSVDGDGVQSPISLIICGGETGPGARPMHPDWARSLRDQCRDAGVAFFFKQWGEWSPDPELDRHGIDNCFVCVDGSHLRPNVVKWGGDPSSTRMFRVGKKAAGRLLDGREWSEMPEVSR